MNTELLELIDAITREKGVEEEDVFLALEHALLKTAMERYGDSPNLSVVIDRKTGEVELYYAYTVVENPVNVYELSLADAAVTHKDAAIGDKIQKKLAFTDFSRTSKKVAANELYKGLEVLRRAREFAEFKDKVGQLTSGVVKRVQPNGDLIVTVGKGIGYLSSKQMLPTESTKHKPGQPIKAYILDVKEIHDTKIEQYQIVLSRTHEQFLCRLLEMEVPEIQDGSVVIKGAVRIPGVRAKVAVVATERGIDPLGACIGAKGARIGNVISELHGECIDVIYWSDNIETFAVNALKPADIIRATSIDNNLVVIVDKEQKNKTIGFKGSNILLASALTKMKISIYTADEEKSRNNELCKFFESALDIDSEMSNSFVLHGFESIKDLNSATDEELAALPGFDQELVTALRERIESYLTRANAFYDTATGLDINIKHIPAIKMLYVEVLYKNNIRTIADIAKLTMEQLTEMLSEFEISSVTSDKIVKFAQKKVLTERIAPRHSEKYASRSKGFGSGSSHSNGPRDREFKPYNRNR